MRFSACHDPLSFMRNPRIPLTPSAPPLRVKPAVGLHAYLHVYIHLRSTLLLVAHATCRVVCNGQRGRSLPITTCNDHLCHFSMGSSRFMDRDRATSSQGCTACSKAIQTGTHCALLAWAADMNAGTGHDDGHRTGCTVTRHSPHERFPRGYQPVAALHAI